MRELFDWEAKNHGSIPKKGFYNFHRFFMSVEKSGYPYVYAYTYDHHSDKGQSSVFVTKGKFTYSTNGFPVLKQTDIHKIIKVRYDL